MFSNFSKLINYNRKKSNKAFEVSNRREKTLTKTQEGLFFCTLLKQKINKNFLILQIRWRKMLSHQQKTFAKLAEDLQEIEWRIEQEAKAYFKVNRIRNEFNSELNVVSIKNDHIW